MGRPPLPLGTWGKISRTEVSPGRCRARAQYRDWDGVTRTIERWGRTKAAAERELTSALRDRATPIQGETITRDTTVAHLGKVWLDGLIADDDISPGTIVQYETTLRVHIAPTFLKIRVGELTTGQVDRFIRTRKTDSVAKRCRIVLNAMMALAARYDAIDVNPVREAISRTPAPKAVRAMTIAEVAGLRANVAAWSAGDGEHPRALDLPNIVDVLIGTGVRIGEVLALRRQDVDLAADPPTVTVAGTVANGKRQDHPKSQSGNRTMVLPAFAAAAVRRQLRLGLPADEQHLVFPSRTGGAREPNNVRRQFRQARGDEFAWVTPHVFRRTVATAIARSEDIEAAAAQLGHAGPAVTRAHYVQRVDRAPDVRHVLEQFSPVTSTEKSS